MKWITRERPKIDRIASPWLIRRFIDQEAEFIYVPFDRVLEQAKVQNAIPFDIPSVEYSHHAGECTFDFIIKKHHITDPAVLTMAPIVRGADTDRHDLASQASGLWAISAGMAYMHPDDHELLEKGMIIYDALYNWAKHLQKEKHTQHPQENLLLEVFDKFLKKRTGKKAPAWAKELKEMIQDHIDTSLSLKELSRDLDINPSYLSREFSRHFGNLSFGEYIRTQRIEKAKELMNNPAHTLTQIAYLTGFSDQSHFTRIFKKYTGCSPSEYRKKM